LNNLLNPPQWTKHLGPEADVVLSSRIRLARNLKMAPFPHQASDKVVVEIAERIKNVIQNSENFKSHCWIDLADLDHIERNVLVEEHIISPNFCFEITTGRAISYNPAKTEALMINEEDHLRIQVISSGLSLRENWIRANFLDDSIEACLDFAFSPEFGYKTACPTNMGTAMRASVMLHIPAIGAMESLPPLLDYISGMGFAVRGLFGEGSNMVGNIIQLVNLPSGGTPEHEMIEKMERLTFQIIKQERNCREKLLSDNRCKTEDTIYRDFALLKSSRMLPIDEFFDRFSSLKLGTLLGVLPAIPGQVLNELMVFIRPAYLQKIYEPHETENALDIRRAELVRNMLRNYNV
jgi:protein arginine kinase